VRKDACKHKIFNHWILQFFNSDDGSSGNVRLSANWYWFARDLVYRVRQYGELRIVRGVVQDRVIFVRDCGVCEAPRFRRCGSNNYSTLAKKTERGVCRLLGVSPPPWGAPWVLPEYFEGWFVLLLGTSYLLEEQLPSVIQRVFFISSFPLGAYRHSFQ